MKKVKTKRSSKKSGRILRVRGIEIVDDKGRTLLSLIANTEAQRQELVGEPVFAGIYFHDPRKSGDIVSSIDNEAIFNIRQRVKGGAK